MNEVGFKQIMPFRNNSRRIILWIIILTLLIFYLGVVYINSQQPISTDFVKLYSSAKLFINNQGIYTPVSIESFGTVPEGIKEIYEKDFLGPNLNPPFQTLLLIPLGYLSFSRAYLLWSLLSIICGITIAVIANREIRQSYDSSFSLEKVLILLFLFFPTFVSVTIGQNSLLLALSLVIAWHAGRNDHDPLAGIALGFALSIKIFTGLFIPILILKRRWRLLKWYIGTFLACNLVSIIIIGFEDHQLYLINLRRITWYAVSWNASLMGLFSRILGGSENVPLVNYPELTSIFYFLGSIILAIFLFRVVNLQQDGGQLIFDLIFSVTLVCMLLISPLGWIYYFPVLIIPFLVSWNNATIQQNTFYKVFLILAWILCTIPHSLVREKNILPTDTLTWAGFFSYGLFVFFGVIYLQLLKLQNPNSLIK